MHPKGRNQKALYENKIAHSGLGENMAIDLADKMHRAQSTADFAQNLRVLSHRAISGMWASANSPEALRRTSFAQSPSHFPGAL